MAKAIAGTHASTGEPVRRELPAIPDRLLLSDLGVVLSMYGPDLKLSRAVRRVLGRKGAAQKYIRWLRQFLAYERVKGESPYAFVTEDFEAALERCIGFLRHIGCVVVPGTNHLDGGFDVSHPTAMR